MSTTRTIAQICSDLTRPNRAEIVRAKSAILNNAGREGGSPVGTLIASFLIEDGLSGEQLSGDTHRVTIDPSDAPNLDELFGRYHPRLHYYRLVSAWYEAAAELIAEGLVIAVDAGPNQGDYRHGGEGFVPVTVGGSSYSEFFSLNFPVVVGPGLRVTTAFASEDVWCLSAEGFVQGCEYLNMSERSIRCSVEALRAYRRGSFLAAASLLGATCEGAWFSAAELLKSFEPKLGKHLANELVSVSTLQGSVAHVLRNRGVKSWKVDELVTTASLFRDVRNYGVHPRSARDKDIESWFTDSSGGLLVQVARRHLLALSAAVEAAVSP